MMIRPLEKADWSATWKIIEPVFRAGDTYSFATGVAELMNECAIIWFC